MRVSTRLDWQVSGLQGSPCLCHSTCHLAFHVCGGDLNLGPYVCTAIILASEPLLWALHLTLMP